MADADDCRARLAAAFEPHLIHWRPLAFQGTQALVVPYVDARTTLDRLDQVLGPANWQEEYQPLPGGQVLCRLKVRFKTAWVTKSDIGSAPPELPAPGRWLRLFRPAEAQARADRRLKAATTDALKRAAVKLGIARDLARALKVWVEWDAVEKKPVTPPAVVFPDADGHVSA